MERGVKININKNDELPIVAARVFAAETDEIVLVVPRLSKISQSADNFRFLKKGLANGNKILMIESVDDRVLKLAEEAGIDAYNPFFKSRRDDSTIRQIVPSADQDEQAPMSDSVGDKVFAEAEKELNDVFQPKRRRWHPVGWTLAVLLLAAGAWFGFRVLPQADITVIAKKINWEFKDKITVEKNAVVDLNKLKIPGQIFSQRKNIQLTFSAAGKNYLKQKAKGKVTVYNGYSSQPQPLVAATRFQAPDGKIVRIDKGIVVPGAKIVDGQIIPSSIEAEATADQPGESYNLNPMVRLTVPGFEGSPKYSGFYGELKEPLSGGYIGEIAAPTKEELAAAKEKTIAAINQSLKNLLLSQIPADFTVLENTFSFKLIQEKIDIQTGGKNEFSLFAEAELAVVGFREKDLLAIISQKMNQELGGEYRIKSHDVNYQPAAVDLDNGRADLLVSFSAVAEKPVNLQDLQNKVMGKSEDELRAMIFALPGLEAAKVSLWPFWTSQVPENSRKIKITVD